MIRSCESDVVLGQVYSRFLRVIKAQ